MSLALSIGRANKLLRGCFLSDSTINLETMTIYIMMYFLIYVPFCSERRSILMDIYLLVFIARKRQVIKLTSR